MNTLYMYLILKPLVLFFYILIKLYKFLNERNTYTYTYFWTYNNYKCKLYIDMFS